MKVYIRFTLADEFVSAHTSLDSAKATIEGAEWERVKQGGGLFFYTNVNPDTPGGFIEEHEVIE